MSRHIPFYACTKNQRDSSDSFKAPLSLLLRDLACNDHMTRVCDYTYTPAPRVEYRGNSRGRNHRVPVVDLTQSAEGSDASAAAKFVASCPPSIRNMK